MSFSAKEGMDWGGVEEVTPQTLNMLGNTVQYLHF